MTVKLAWADDDDPSCSIGATFQSLSGASFVVNGAAMATDSALVTLAAEKKWLNGWSAAATVKKSFRCHPLLYVPAPSMPD